MRVALTRATRPLVVFRPDAGPGCGRGHVARCAAIAHAVRACGGRTLTLLPHDEPAHPLAGPVHRLPPTRRGRGGGRDLARVRAIRPDAWMVDSYHVAASDLAAVRSLAPVWVPMDVPRRAADADGVFAPLQFPRGTASDVPAGRRLFGPRYAPLPPNLGSARRAGRGDRVVVSFGAEDLGGLTVPVARRLAADGWRVAAVVGPAMRHRASVTRQLAALGSAVRPVDGRRGLVPVLRRASWAVLPPSQSMWEALGLGLPTVVVETAANQTAGRRWAARSRVVVDAGRASPRTPGRVAAALGRLRASARDTRSLVRRAQHAVDGRGASRIARALLASATGAPA